MHLAGKKCLHLLLFMALAHQISMAEIRVLAVTDSASFSTRLPEAGSLATIFCTGLEGIHGTQTATTNPLPHSIAGVSVRFDAPGSDAPLLAVTDFGSYQQINIQVPGQPWVPVTVSQGGQTASFAWTDSATWNVFFTDPAGYAAAQHSLDYSPVTADNPARPGEVIILYGTNVTTMQLPYVSNPPAIGYQSPSVPLAWVLLQIPYGGFTNSTTVVVNGEGAAIRFLGLAPGLVGVYQANVEIPSDIPDGDAMVALVRSSCRITFGCDQGSSTPAKVRIRSAGAAR